MNLLKELAEKETTIKLETQKCKEEFYGWYIKNGGGTEYRNLKELDYNTIALWYWEEKDTSYYNYSSGKYDYTWKQLKQKYNIGDDKMFTKENLISGKHWVETKNGMLGAVMEYNILFENGEIFSLMGYHNDLTIKNKEFYEHLDIDIIYEINNEKDRIQIYPPKLNPITTLDQLEQVRKEMCKKYNTSFYITNQDGEWEIKFNGKYKQIGIVDMENNIELELPFDVDIYKGLHYTSIKNKLNAKCNDNIYLDWEHQGELTTNPFRAVDLEKEGYELRLGD